ncbi:MAG TPA: hypothetical protein VMU77_03025 [Acidimicrobiales bacterium]|nr:hypothetical protein [Acidimicrobiales bacterium]
MLPEPFVRTPTGDVVNMEDNVGIVIEGIVIPLVVFVTLAVFAAFTVLELVDLTFFAADILDRT